MIGLTINSYCPNKARIEDMFDDNTAKMMGHEFDFQKDYKEMMEKVGNFREDCRKCEEIDCDTKEILIEMLTNQEELEKQVQDIKTCMPKIADLLNLD